MIHARFTNTYSEFHSKCATPVFDGIEVREFVQPGNEQSQSFHIGYNRSSVEQAQNSQSSLRFWCVKNESSPQYMMSYHVISILYITTYLWNKCIHMLLSCGLAHFISSWLSLCLSKFGLCNELTGIGVRSSKDVWAWQSANIRQKGKKKIKQHVVWLI